MIRRLFTLGLLFTPIITFANIQITEIMYDLEGSDTKGEWIEVYNGGNAPVDITDWRFNDGANHKFVGDNLILESGSYAIIASDAASVTNSGNIIDTVMSLNNTEDTVSLIDSDGEYEDSVTYTSEQGASGNGYSLQLIGEKFVEGSPTPNQPNVFEVIEEEEEPSSTSRETDVTEPQVSYSSIAYINSDISAYAGEDINGVTSALIEFEGAAFGLLDKPLTNARYFWNFGDGSVEHGQRVFHTYTYPGTYNVTLSAASSEFSTSDSLQIIITQADVEIVFADKEKIEVANYSNQELDVSFWRLKYGDEYFNFPKGTILLPKNKGIFPSNVTNLFVDSLQELSLLYPNGIVAYTFQTSVKNIPLENDARYNARASEIYEVERTDVRTYVENTSLSVDKGKESIIFATQTAEVIQSIEGKGGNSLYKWLLALIALISIAALALLSQDSIDKPTSSKEVTADDFKILE